MLPDKSLAQIVGELTVTVGFGLTVSTISLCSWLLFAHAPLSVIAKRMVAVSAEMKVLRSEWSARLRAKAAANL